MNKKGFTLIEVLAVIIIIGIIAIIAVPTISKYLNQAKDSAYVSYEKSMIDAAKNKVMNCIENNEECDLPEGEEEQKMFLDILIDEGYLENMKDPESNNLCEELESYVTIKGETAKDYKYKACLACGEYFTDDTACRKKEGDGDPPVCGVVVGESTRWTNQNRTVTVGCTDSTSGCEQAAFSKTFNKTTKEGIITIRDRSGTSQTCSVNAYVDKTLPTCKIKAEGEYIESTGWWSLRADTKLEEMIDTDSGILTYGIGTSLKNKDYNKKTNMVIESGITTVIGYVKDVAGNEGICSEEIRVGTEVPKFNLYYGYTVYPNKEPYTLNDMEETELGIKNTGNNPKLIINNTTKYKEVEKIIITLNSGINETASPVITYGEKSSRAIINSSDKVIEFIIEKGNYSSYEITLGTTNGNTYSINKIELLTKDGTLWTNKDITMYVEPVDEGMKTIEVSYDNGETWGTTFQRTYNETTSGNIKTRNGILMQSESVPFNVKVDKVMPTLTITAKRATTGVVVPLGSYTNEGLNYTFNVENVGISGAHIYYCKDTENSCNPNIEVSNGETVTLFNTITTNYYIRYEIVSNAESSGEINVYDTKFDLTKPTCTFGTVPTLHVHRTATIDLNCEDDLSGIPNNSIDASNFTVSNGNLEITNVSNTAVSNGVKYTLTLSGKTDGEVSITLKENQIRDNAANTNNSSSVNINVQGVFKITLNNQSATTEGTQYIYELYNKGWYTDNMVTTEISTITIPTRNGYLFDGYFTETNGLGTKIIDVNGNIENGKTGLFTEDTTIYAKWNECENGYYCANNTKIVCPAGTYGSGTTTAGSQAEGCTICPANSYCTGGTAIASCEGGKSSRSGSIAETDCFNPNYDYGYTGGIQTFTAPATGYYLLEIWGAQGGSPPGGYTGGYGGYATGVVYLEKNANLYIAVGGAGGSASYPGQTVYGGYNGGGTVSGHGGVNHITGAGGGATHIATTNRGTIPNYNSYRDELLIVAGGGGGGRNQANHEPAARWGYGGSGGGASSSGAYSSNNTYTITQQGYCIATQTSGPSFGQGENCHGNSAGGGGYMGGYSGAGSCPQYLGVGSGGSGYIGSSQLISKDSVTKHMTCYTCSANSTPSTYTIRTTSVSSSAISDYAKSGSGYAKIKWFGE